MNIDIYSTVAGELPKMVEKKQPLCFIPYEQFLEYQKEMEEKLFQLEGESLKDENTSNR